MEMATLPEPDGAYEEAVDDAETEVERTVKAIFRQVLGVTRLTLHDSFFDIGGDSLIAAQLMALVSKEFSIEAPARTFYEAPTVADLAALVDARCVGQLEEITRCKKTMRVPASPAAGSPAGSGVRRRSTGRRVLSWCFDGSLTACQARAVLSNRGALCFLCQCCR